MEQWPEHSVQGYLTRLPTDKLEELLDKRENSQYALGPKDYELIEVILRSRPDSKLYGTDL